MRILAVLSLFFGFAAAAQVPSFSANDDYDEINLNIRMLSNHTTPDEIVVEVVTVSGSFSASLTVPAGTDVAALNADTAIKAAICAQVLAAGGLAPTSTCEVTISAASRRGRALQDTLDVVITYTLSLAPSAASSFETLVASGSATTFESALTTGLTTALTAIDPAYAVASVTSAGATVSTSSGTTTAATSTETTTAAPASSPSSSNASMLKANVALAAVAALIASVFA